MTAYLGEFGITEMDFNRAYIVLYPVYMFGSRNRNNPWFLGKKPCQSDPCRSSSLFAGEFLHISGKSDIMLEILTLKTGNVASEIIIREFGRGIEPSCEHSFSEWTERDKADSEFLKRWQQFLLRFPVPHGVFTLYGSYRTDCIGTPYC